MPNKKKRKGGKRKGFGSGKKNATRVRAGNSAYSLAEYKAPPGDAALSVLQRRAKGQRGTGVWSSLFANGLATVISPKKTAIELGGESRRSEILALWPRLRDHQKRAILRLDEDLIRQILKRDMVETICCDDGGITPSDKILAEIETKCMEEDVDPRMVNAVQVCVLRSLELTVEAREYAITMTLAVARQFAGRPDAARAQLGLEEGAAFPTARLQARRARELGAGVIKPPKNKTNRLSFNLGEYVVTRAVEERLLFELTRRVIHEQCALVIVYFGWISTNRYRWLLLLLVAVVWGNQASQQVNMFTSFQYSYDFTRRFDRINIFQ
jgi:hypothetical protein